MLSGTIVSEAGGFSNLAPSAILGNLRSFVSFVHTVYTDELGFHMHLHCLSLPATRLPIASHILSHCQVTAGQCLPRKDFGYFSSEPGEDPRKRHRNLTVSCGHRSEPLLAGNHGKTGFCRQSHLNPSCLLCLRAHSGREWAFRRECTFH